MNTEADSLLGKPTHYQEHYNPALLFPIAREEKRQAIGITGALPFMGADIWNAYELSWLNARGKPQVALAQFIIPANSPYLIESKSFKLYLNSFNQTKIEKEHISTYLKEDLSRASGAQVQVKLIEPPLFHQEKMGALAGYCIDNLEIEVKTYHPDPSLLRVASSQAPVEEILTSNLLKSNCPVTAQPDWASISIHYTGVPIQRDSLLHYLISFRQHNEFHEQCVEQIFMDITRQCAPTKLAVYARYTRRGGLDINPFRTNFSGTLPANMRTARQ
jgi:7-cyano-7-deazaguanine reductase